MSQIEKHQANLSAIGFNDSQIARILSGEITTLQAVAEKYFLRSDKINPIEKWNSVAESAKQGFFDAAFEIYQKAYELKPDVIVFPQRGAEPIHWALDQINEAASKAGLDRLEYTALAVPLGNTENLDFADATGNQMGLAKALTEIERNEIEALVKPEGYNGKDPTQKRNLDRAIRKEVKKRVVKSYLETYEKITERKPRKIMLVDEVQQGGTILEHHDIFKEILAEEATQGETEGKLYTLAYIQDGKTQREAFTSRLPTGEIEVLTRQFPMIDQDLLLPLILRGKPDDYAATEGAFLNTYELIEYIGNDIFKDLLQTDIVSRFGKNTSGLLGKLQV